VALRSRRAAPADDRSPSKPITPRSAADDRIRGRAITAAAARLATPSGRSRQPCSSRSSLPTVAPVPLGGVGQRQAPQRFSGFWPTAAGLTSCHPRQGDAPGSPRRAQARGTGLAGGERGLLLPQTRSCRGMTRTWMLMTLSNLTLDDDPGLRSDYVVHTVSVWGAPTDVGAPRFDDSVTFWIRARSGPVRQAGQMRR
jgi:hypothetical protein